MAEKEEKILERTYNVPLRKEYRKVANWRRTEKAVTGLKKFLVRHMKSEDIKIGKEVNEFLWKHGIKNPPHHVKIEVTKDEKGVVKAELFGMKKKEVRKKVKKSAPKKEEAPAKKEVKTEEAVSEKKETVSPAEEKEAPAQN